MEPMEIFLGGKVLLFWLFGRPSGAMLAAGPLPAAPLVNPKFDGTE